MGSSGAAVIGLTVPARGGTDVEREPEGERFSAPLRSAGGLSAYLSVELCFSCSAFRAQQAGCSVCGRGSRLDLCRHDGSQPVIVILQIFDQALEIANPRPESITLQHETIIEIHPLTQ
jgi:hypothetical protein